MDISFELYKVFYYVATTLSFSEASRQLYISQSAVSQSIKALEQKLGHALFLRNKKKVTLTPEGESLLRHVEPAVNLLFEGENQILNSPSLEAPLRIGASDTICRYYLVTYLNRFHKEFPNIHIKVTNHTSIECARVLENGQCDFIVANYPNSALSGNLHTRVINEFHDVFVASRQAFDLEGKVLTLNQLLNYPIMMLDRKSTTSEFLHQIFQKNRLDLVPEIELSSNDLLIDLARIGLGIAFVPDFCIPEHDRDLFILELSETLPGRQMVVAYNENLPVSQAAKHFMEML